MVLFKFEMKRNLKSLIIWSIILASLIMMLMSMYSQTTMEQQALNEKMQDYPEAMIKMFNMDKLDYGTLLGFYAVQGFFIVTLLGSIFAATNAASVLAKEENNKTIEFLLSKPISRGWIIGQKILAVLLNIIIFDAIIAGATWISFSRGNGTNIDVAIFIWLIVIAPLFLHLTFAALSFLVSAILKKGRNMTTLALAIVFTGYIFNILSGINEQYANLKYLSPFQYVNAAEIISNSRIDGLYLLLIFVIIVVSVFLSFIVYQKKDMIV